MAISLPETELYRSADLMIPDHSGWSLNVLTELSETQPCDVGLIEGSFDLQKMELSVRTSGGFRADVSRRRHFRSTNQPSRATIDSLERESVEHRTIGPVVSADEVQGFAVC